MELPIDATEEDSWWLQEANNDTDQSDEDAFGEFKQAQPVQAAQESNSQKPEEKIRSLQNNDLNLSQIKV